MELTAEQWASHCRELYPVPDFIGHGVALDIGANVGGFPLAYHDRFERIICVEPCSETFKQLVNNTAHLKNVHCLNLAVGRHNGLAVKLRRHRDHPSDSGCHSTTQHEEWGNDVIQSVPTINFFSITSLATTAISYMKVDCEGAEFSFLGDAAFTVSLKVKAIAIELHAQWPDKVACLKQRLERYYAIHHSQFIDPHENILYVRR
ncbi:MAG: FkbM family methyltransferase [Patescibacteria group bacterium]|nr:FkbM family methyltransferase [Patescibacteria group bacterium]